MAAGNGGGNWWRHVLPVILAWALAAPASAQLPQLNAPLPLLQIEALGEVLLAGDDYRFQPWSSGDSPGKVHVIQLFNGTVGDSKIFEPFTDGLQAAFEPGGYHVTTIINLDAALWGTTGFVVSQVKKNKRKYPRSSLVLDEEGIGARAWELGKKGAALVIVAPDETVRYLTLEAMTDQEIAAGLELVGSYFGEAPR